MENLTKSAGLVQGSSRNITGTELVEQLIDVVSPKTPGNSVSVGSSVDIYQLQDSTVQVQISASDDTTVDNDVEEIFLVKNESPSATDVQLVSSVIDQGSTSDFILVQPDSDLQVTKLSTNAIMNERIPARSEIFSSNSFEFVGNTPAGSKEYKCLLCNSLTSDIIQHRYAHSDQYPYLCDHKGCCKAYKRKRNLKYHVLTTHTAVNPVCRCSKCGKVFKSEYLLKKHINIICTDMRPFVCNICGKKFKTAQSKAYHETIHANTRPFKCSVCNKMLGSKAHLRRHEMDAHTENIYQCQCGKNFKSLRRYKEHYRAIHDPSNPYRCSYCQRNLKNEESLKKHQITHTYPYSCRICKKGFKLYIMCQIHEKSKHQIPHCELAEVNDHTCPICRKEFKTKLSLYSHLSIHSGDKPYNCVRCGTSFQTKQRLQSHNLNVHVDRRFSCGECDKKFKSRSHLKIHLESHDTSYSNRYQCDDCGIKFSSKSYLKIHKEKHVKGTVKAVTHICPYCKQLFPSIKNVKIHIKQEHPHMPGYDECAHECPICGQVFKQQKHLSGHLQNVHVEKHLPCPECPKRFKNTTHLKIHMASHIKPYQCLQCGSRFATEKYLTTHRAKHEKGFVAFTCPYCSKEFPSPGTVDAHIEQTHPMMPKIERNKESKEVLKYKTQNLLIFNCELCVAQFAAETKLTDHELKCHFDPQNRCRCKRCNVQFATLRTLKMHLFSVHGQGLQYCCGLCGRKFCQRVDLYKHEGVVHSKFHGVNSVDEIYGMQNVTNFFVCLVCKMVASDEDDLIKHERTHRNEEFSCTLCGFRLTDLDGFKRHLWSCAPLTCIYCKEKFISIEDYQDHIWRHESGEIISRCDVCGLLYSLTTSPCRHKGDIKSLNEKPFNKMLLSTFKN